MIDFPRAWTRLYGALPRVLTQAPQRAGHLFILCGTRPLHGVPFPTSPTFQFHHLHFFPRGQTLRAPHPRNLWQPPSMSAVSPQVEVASWHVPPPPDPTTVMIVPPTSPFFFLLNPLTIPRFMVPLRHPPFQALPTLKGLGVPYSPVSTFSTPPKHSFGLEAACERPPPVVLGFLRPRHTDPRPVRWAAFRTPTQPFGGVGGLGPPDQKVPFFPFGTGSGAQKRTFSWRQSVFSSGHIAPHWAPTITVFPHLGAPDTYPLRFCFHVRLLAFFFRSFLAIRACLPPRVL